MDEPALRSKKGGANWLRTLLWLETAVYFDQCLGAAHSKAGLISPLFLVLRHEKC